MTPEEILLAARAMGVLPAAKSSKLNEVPFAMGDPRMEEERQRLERDYLAGRAAQRKTFKDAPIEEQIKAIGNTAGFFGGAVLEGLAEPFAKLGGGTAEGSLTDYFTPKTPAQSAALGESAEALYPVAQAFEAAKIPDITPGMLTSPTRLFDDATRQAAMAAKQGVKTAGRAASSMEDMLRQKLGAPVGSIQLAQPQQTQTPLGFYSALDRAADSLQNKGTGQQFLNQLTNMQGVKGDEIKWTGLDEFLKGKKDVTKQEVKDYLSANQVKLEEVRLESEPKQYYVYDLDNRKVAGPFDSDVEAERAMEDVIVDEQQTLNRHSLYYDENLADVQNSYKVDEGGNTRDDTKFSEYSTPGGKNYRELLLTLPSKEPKIFNYQVIGAFPRTGFSSREAAQAYIDHFTNVLSDPRSELDPLRAQVANYPFNIYEYEAVGSQPNTFKSNHFDQPNILAHMRVSDFEQDGKKIMLVDEVQSDWHQAGRKRGYAQQEAARIPGKVVDSGDGTYRVEWDDGTFSGGYNWASAMEVAEKGKSNATTGVPDAPFKTTWHELALRRAVREASERGFDKIAIPTGSVQNDRYKLSNFVNAIDYRKNDDGTYGLIALDDEGNSVITKNRLTESELEDTIGKEMAKKIVNGVGESFEEGSTAAKEGYKKISGIDLEVGGEGMKGFYDQMVPKYLNKLGSKFGTKVTRGTIKDADGEDVPVHELTITPQMRKSVLEQGQPLFAAVPAVGLTQEEEGYAKGGAVRKKPVNRLKPGARFIKFANGGAVSGIQPYSLDAKAARKYFDVPGVGPVEMFVDEASKRLVVSDEGYWNPKSPVGKDLEKVVDWARSQGYQAGVVVTPYASERFGQDMVANVSRRMPGATDDQLREYVNAADFVIVDPYIVNPESATPDMQNWMSTFTKNVGQYAQDQGKDAWLYLQGFAPSSVGNEVVENYNRRLIDENKGTYDQLSFFNMSDFPDYEDNRWAQQINIDPLLTSLTPEKIEPTADVLRLQQFDNELQTRIDNPQTQLNRLSANTDLFSAAIEPVAPAVMKPIKEVAASPVVPDMSYFGGPDTSPSSLDILAGYSAPAAQPIKPAIEIDSSFGVRSPYEKAQEYNRMLRTASDQDIRDAATRTFGAQSDENWQGLQSMAERLRALQATAQMNPLDVTTTRQLAGGGAIKKAAKAAKEAAKVDVESQAPMVLVPSKISDLKEAIRQSKGNYGAKRVERAADEIRNLEALFQEQALREAFGGDNAKALMTMNPKDFEKFAEPIDVRFINPTSSRYTSTGEIVPYSEYMESYLPSVGAFESIPFLEINKKQQGKKQLPFISGHEGRHRSRVMSNKGEQASLVQLFPRYNLREPFPRRSQEEYIEALKKELGLTGNLVEPEIIFDSFQQGEIKRPAIPLPDIYANGGVVKKAGGGAIKKAAKAASKASEPKEQPIYWGMYRGYAGDDVSATEPQFAAMDKKVAEYYAKKRAAQTGLPPHLEMILKDLEAGRKYGHTVPMDEHNRELLITQAYELQPEEIKGRYQLKKRGGRVKGNI
jgi:hypothetical protein